MQVPAHFYADEDIVGKSLATDPWNNWSTRHVAGS